jgi:predicted nuclease of predicted toxin-antitoxin system
VRYYADEWFDHRVVRALRAVGADVRTAADAAQGATDPDVLSAASADDRILLTQDKGFGALIFQSGHTSSGVVLARIEGLDGKQVPTIAARILALPDHGRGAFTTLDLEGQRLRPLP